MLKIGLTYDLKDDYLKEGYNEEETAELDRPDTIDAIDAAIQSHGYRTERIGNIFQLNQHLAERHRWDLVFNICEGMHGLGREALVPALLDAYRIPYTFSEPLVLSLTLHKGFAKSVVRDLGVPTPDFALVDQADDIDRIDLPFPLFAKPVAEGSGKGISSTSIIHDRDQLRSVCRELLQHYQQQVLVERYLSGREFTAGIVGTGSRARVIGAMEVIFHQNREGNIYSYQNKKNYEEIVEYRLVEPEIFKQCETIALQVWQGLYCRDAGRIDLRMDDSGRVHFLEINPLAGLHPIHSDLPIICSLIGTPYSSLIGDIVNSALERAGRPVQ
ncbi:MAG: D-alanine--D-alanine ligase [Candidatus Delongbacteria bacterium]|nr:D-alanine--D-alanine ligase [Candidatus Delongbacteria bacterium]